MILVGFIIFLDIFIALQYFLSIRFREPNNKHMIFAWLFLLTSLGIYLPFDFLDMIDIANFYMIISVMFGLWLVFGFVYAIRNGTYEQVQKFKLLFYSILGILISGAVILLIGFLIISPIENNFGLDKAMGTFFLMIGIIYGVMTFIVNDEPYRLLKELSIPIFFLLFSVICFLDHFEKWVIICILGVSLLCNLIGRFLIHRHENKPIPINRRF
ncbi:hypothetical protein EV282_0470 [Fictibacillus sp. BK138]|nr:hypothetical protein EV282_0470 [Fictibacillus sp. BK138]